MQAGTQSEQAPLSFLFIPRIHLRRFENMSEAAIDFTPLEELFEDGSVHIACPDPETAQELTQELYDVHGDSEDFHVEHHPVTDDDAGQVESVSLLIRRLHYDRDTGWWSADIRSEPDIVV